MKKIIESKRIVDVLQYITPDTLVIFDIDNTLIEPVQPFGGHAWFLNLVQRFKRQGLQEFDAILKASEILKKMQAYISFKTVEPYTPEVIEQLKQQQIDVMAMTSRGQNFVECTCETLNACNITFRPTTIYDKQFHFGTIGCWQDGILYTGDERSKGETLISFFEESNYFPTHVLFIDDSQCHVESVSVSLGEKNISSMCIRYGATDDRAAQFNSEAANKALLHVIGSEQYKDLFRELDR